MELFVIGSSSKGNCYLLQGQHETLIIEAGVRFAEIKKALNFDLGKVAGAIVTHQHKDHSFCVGDLLKSGIHVYSHETTYGGDSYFFHAVEPMKSYMIGGFRITALPAKHDVPCFAYVINHAESGKILFLTDSVSFDYSIKGVKHLLVEANYSDKILEENILKGIEPASMRGRLLCSHCELQTTKSIIEAQQTQNVREVVLLHLSSRNSQPAAFESEIIADTGLVTYVADAGLQINLSNE